MIKADFHTHTRYSHGKGSVMDNAINALSLGLRAVAITDHARCHPLVGVKPEKIDEIRKDVINADKELKNIKVLLGLEANIISRNGDIDVSDEDAKKLDLLLLGFHLTAYQKSLKDYFYLPFNGCTRMLFKNTERQKNRNTDTIVKAVVNNDIDILTHPGFRIDVDYRAIAAACAFKGTYMELSSRHATPREKDIEVILETGAKLIVNSDAHKPVNIGKCEYAMKLIDKMGLGENEVVNLSDKPIQFLRGLKV